jgi:ATP-dependent Clp protease ATP-binding subunit ClpA
MFERFTTRAREVVIGAEAEAAALGHAQIGTEHLLLAMLRPDSVAYAMLSGAGLTHDGVRDQVIRIVGPGQLGPEDAEALSAIGIDLDAVLAKLEENFGSETLGGSAPRGRRRFAPRAKKVLELALREAIALHSRHLGTEHLLLGLIREGEGVGARAIVDSGVSLADLRAATLSAITKAA